MNLKKKIYLGLVMGMMVSSTAFANPFDDVPRDSWSYDAVQMLIKNGVIDNYNENIYNQNKVLTRYDMSHMVGRAISRQKTATPEDQAVIDKLSQEYSDELTALGIRVAGVEKETSDLEKRTATLEKETAGIRDLKISHWFQTENTYGNVATGGEHSAHEYELEYRLTVEKQISPKLGALMQIEAQTYWDQDHWRQERSDDGVYARLAYVKYRPDEKTTFLGGKNAYWLAGGALGDDFISGVYASHDFGNNTVAQLAYGYYNGSQNAKTNLHERILYGGVDTKLGSVDVGAHYITGSRNLVTEDRSRVWALTAGANLGKSGINLSGAYGQNSAESSDNSLKKVQLYKKIGQTDTFLQYWRQGGNLNLPIENGNHLTWWGDEYNSDGHQGYRLILGYPVSTNCYAEAWYGTYKNLVTDERGHKFGWAMTFTY